MIRQQPSRIGAMANRSDILCSSASVGAVLATMVVAVVLNVPGLQYEPLFLWVRIGCPLLLFIGFLGSLYGSRLLRLLGWFGILLFLGCAMAMIFPGEDYTSGGPDGPSLAAPHLVSAQETVLRLILFLVLIAVLISSYLRLGVWAAERKFLPRTER